MNFQRLRGFGFDQTAWSWLHKLRAAIVRSGSGPRGLFVELDKALDLHRPYALDAFADKRDQTAAKAARYLVDRMAARPAWPLE